MYYQLNVRKTKNDKGKSILSAIIWIFVIICLFTLIFLLPLFINSNSTASATSAEEYGQQIVINDNTKLWKTPTFNADDASNILEKLSKGTVVDVIEKTDTYYEVKVNDKKGFLRDFDLKEVTQIDTEYQVKQVKATTKKLGEKIKMYKEPTEDSEVVFEVRDGQRLQVIDEGNENFYSAIYNGKTCYIKKVNSTTGLSQSQLTALIVSVVCALTIIIIFLIVYLTKNLQNKREHQKHLG